MNSYIYALGFFDGVHAGHQALLDRCRELAEKHHLRPGAITFGSHPDTLVLGQTPPLINTPEDREQLLRHFGMKRVVTLPFDRKMCQTHWQDFLSMLEQQYGAAGFVCGEDFRFGAQGKGNAALLSDYCGRDQKPCAIVPDQMIQGTRVSSTHIRRLLEQGEMEQAVRFLGHPHILTGQVIPGKQLGRTLGIPTANLHLPEGMVVPRFGVYACRVLIEGVWYPAVTNVGTRPTVSGTGITVEPWILNFSGDLYGQTLFLEFHSFLRPEQRFSSLDALKAEIYRNADQTLEYFSNHRC